MSTAWPAPYPLNRGRRRNSSERPDSAASHLSPAPKALRLAPKMPITVEAATGLIARLRAEDFNRETETKLRTHPLLAAAAAGKLTMAQLRAIAGEQYRIQRTDAKSFALLAGLKTFAVPPHTEVGDVVLPPGTTDDFFGMLLGGEVMASGLLPAFAKGAKMTRAEMAEYDTTAMCQGYPNYWSTLALEGNRVAGAAAAAVNFPAWGEMCARLQDSLADPSLGYGYDGKDDPALGFIAFFASPIPDFDHKAAATIAESAADGGVDYETLRGHVRRLQECELMFWDGIFAAASKSSQ
mmetsp:Transcript_7501/g.19317  ORF Transcript_7501/g.19317 Transcript_7501/m.19317 type:complete len:296 (+) Transcript_7501:256-1143(+)